MEYIVHGNIVLSERVRPDTLYLAKSGIFPCGLDQFGGYCCQWLWRATHIKLVRLRLPTSQHFIRWSGTPLATAEVAAPVLKLWPKYGAGSIPTSFKMVQMPWMNLSYCSGDSSPQTSKAALCLGRMAIVPNIATMGHNIPPVFPRKMNTPFPKGSVLARRIWTRTVVGLLWASTVSSDASKGELLDADAVGCFTSGRRSSWATESISLPRKVRVVDGASTFSGATVRPSLWQVGIAVSRNLEDHKRRNHPNNGWAGKSPRRALPRRGHPLRHWRSLARTLDRMAKLCLRTYGRSNWYPIAIGRVGGQGPSGRHYGGPALPSVHPCRSVSWGRLRCPQKYKK